MTRRALLLAATVVVGCGGRESPFLFPQQAGAWARAAAPAPADPPSGAKRAWQATYDGPFPVKVTIAEMLSGQTAFEAMQRWRAQSGKLPFYRLQYFGVADAPSATTKDLDSFVHAFEEASAK